MESRRGQTEQKGERTEKVRGALRISDSLTALTLLECFHKLSGRSLRLLPLSILKTVNVFHSLCACVLAAHISHVAHTVLFQAYELTFAQTEYLITYLM